MKIRNLTLAAVVAGGLVAMQFASAGSAEAKTIYVGSANGGVWKTTDGGAAQQDSALGGPDTLVMDDGSDGSGLLVPAVQKVRCASRYC